MQQLSARKTSPLVLMQQTSQTTIQRFTYKEIAPRGSYTKRLVKPTMTHHHPPLCPFRFHPLFAPFRLRAHLPSAIHPPQPRTTQHGMPAPLPTHPPPLHPAGDKGVLLLLHQPGEHGLAQTLAEGLRLDRFQALTPDKHAHVGVGV